MFSIKILWRYNFLMQKNWLFLSCKIPPSTSELFVSYKLWQTLATMIKIYKSTWCENRENMALHSFREQSYFGFMMTWLLLFFWAGGEVLKWCRPYFKRPGYRFTKGLTQNLNLRTNLKLKYNIKSLNNIQPNFRFQASFLYYWTMSFTFSTWSVV